MDGNETLFGRSKEKDYTFALRLHKIFQINKTSYYISLQHPGEICTASIGLQQPIRKPEVKKLIQESKTIKGPGWNLIHKEVAKELPDIVICFLTVSFNRMLALTYFPRLWKILEKRKSME